MLTHLNVHKPLLHVKCSRVLERNQYAFKVSKDGTWFFTISISTTHNGDKPNRVENLRQTVIGQLARIPRNSQKIEVLLRIDNFVTIPKQGEKESKVQMSVGGHFHSGDLILLRMLPPSHDIFVTIYGIREVEEPYPGNAESTSQTE